MISFNKKGWFWMCRSISKWIIIGARAGMLDHMSSSFDAEGNALFQALIWVESAGWDDCHFIIDYCELLNSLKSGCRSLNGANACITKCSWMLLRNSKWKVTLVRREDNYIADKLANKAVMEEVCDFSSHTIPSGVWGISVMTAYLFPIILSWLFIIPLWDALIKKIKLKISNLTQS